MSSAEKIEIYKFHPAVLILVPLLALVAQSYLPVHWSELSIVDLPMLVIIYFGLTRRSPVQGMISGALIGLAQDALSRGPIGMLGAAKTVLGYTTTFVSEYVATEGKSVRAVTIFIFYWLHFLILYAMTQLLLGGPMEADWLRLLSGALANTLVGMLLFVLLDRFRKPA